MQSESNHLEDQVKHPSIQNEKETNTEKEEEIITPIHAFSLEVAAHQKWLEESFRNEILPEMETLESFLIKNGEKFKVEKIFLQKEKIKLVDLYNNMLSTMNRILEIPDTTNFSV